MQEVLLRNTKRGLYGSSGQLVSALALKVLPALAAASVPRDYSTVAVTLVKVL